MGFAVNADKLHEPFSLKSHLELDLRLNLRHASRKACPLSL